MQRTHSIKFRVSSPPGETGKAGTRGAYLENGPMIPQLIGAALAALAFAGAAYMALAAALVGRYRMGDAPGLAVFPPVTVLKPLYGPEPCLDENLAATLAQDYPGRVQTIFGVARGADPALAAVASARLCEPARAVDVVVDASRHGSNAKVGNLLNMAARARHGVIVMADSDMAVPPSHLSRVVAELQQPGVGAVTCLYRGRGDRGFWSKLAAAGISWQFLPGVVVGRALGLAEPCMGATIALNADTLHAIGGFGAFTDTLADDHAMGAAVRARGLAISAPAMLLAHGSAERDLGELARRELRANATVREIEPLGFVGSLIAHPLPLALLAVLAMGATSLSLSALAAALVARLGLVFAVDHAAGERTAPVFWLPMRDLLSFGLFVAAFFVRQVDWRGARLDILGGGLIAPTPEPAL